MLAGLVVLAGLWVLASQRAASPIPPPSVLPTASVTGAASTASPTLTPGATPIGPATRADDWANTLLDRVVPLFQSGLKKGPGLAWWENESASGILVYKAGQVTWAGAVFSPGNASQIVIAIPNPTNPDSLLHVGTIQVDQAVEVLTVLSLGPSDNAVRWIATNPDTTAPFQALAVQAAARALTLSGAYSDSSEDGAEMVIVAISPMAQGTLELTATPTGPSPTPGRTPSPTPTREPDVVLGRLISQKLDEVIKALTSVVPQSAAAFAAKHPLIGPLTWTETGPRIADRPMGVRQAIDLDVQTLAPGMTDGLTIPVLTAVIDPGDVTRLPSDKMYFQGNRMEEILYWLVYASTGRSGVLTLSYDDFGAHQVITIVGFTPFSQIPR